MRRASIFTMIVLAGLAILIVTSWSRQAHEIIPWQTDFKAASAESRKTGKPMLLDFTAEWCGPCQEMRRTTWSDPQVAAALAGYVPVKIDVDSNADLASQFGVQGIPHLTVLNPQGELVKTVEGGMPSSAFLDWLRKPPGH